MSAGRCTTHSKGWLDQAAVLMAVVCGIHCLATPFLLVALPIIGTTFWANENFHFWMLILVVPTTTLAAFSGCRKHKDRLVAVFAAIGLLILVSATAMESFAASAADGVEGSGAFLETADCADAVACSSCCSVGEISEGESTASLAFSFLSTEALLNLAGGLFLVVGHIRNFRLCRASRCCSGLPAISR